ncbi:MAG TPA: ATP-binding protein [Coriobacteriia bacterium]|jgi:hypothetical protein
MTDDNSLIDFVAGVSGEGYLKVEEDFGDGFVRLRISEAERRQAKHDIRSFEDVVVEVLRNSRDAHARRIFLANSREGELRSLTVIDDGVGVPPHLHDRIFEPRVTSKLETMVTDSWGVHGRGMALFSIRENVLSARVASSDLHRGMSLSIVSDCNGLSERADQSTWPVVEAAEEGGLKVVRGPHNIIRRVLEFASEHPEVSVYVGTPTDVIATLHMIGRGSLASADLLFCDDVSKLPVWQRPAVAADAAELVEIAAGVGLAVSERTAHRVLAGELPALEPALAVAAGSIAPAGEREPSAPDIYRDRRGLKIHHADLGEFKRELERAFDVIAERYYLHLKAEPKVVVGRDEIRVRFTVEKED